LTAIKENVAKPANNSEKDPFHTNPTISTSANSITDTLQQANPTASASTVTEIDTSEDNHNSSNTGSWGGWGGWISSAVTSASKVLESLETTDLLETASSIGNILHNFLIFPSHSFL